jgi:hypothetical protein
MSGIIQSPEFPLPIAYGTPVTTAVAASLIQGELKFTALTAGDDGNQIAVEVVHVRGVGPFQGISLSDDGSATTISLCTRQRLKLWELGGATWNGVNSMGLYPYPLVAGQYNDALYWTDDNLGDPETSDGTYLYYEETRWVLVFRGSGGTVSAQWDSSPCESTVWPDEAGAFLPQGTATGSFTVTAMTNFVSAIVTAIGETSTNILVETHGPITGINPVPAFAPRALHGGKEISLALPRLRVNAITGQAWVNLVEADHTPVWNEITAS